MCEKSNYVNFDSRQCLGNPRKEEKITVMKFNGNVVASIPYISTAAELKAGIMNRNIDLFLGLRTGLGVVFAFMIGTGMIHWAGLHGNSEAIGSLSATIRLIVSATFASLYMAEILDGIALLVALYDGGYALIYWLILRGRR